MGENYLPKQEYIEINKQYESVKADIKEGHLNTASARVTGILYELDRMVLEEQNPEKIEEIKKLTEQFERFDRAIQLQIKKPQPRTKILMRNKTGTIDKLLEKVA